MSLFAGSCVLSFQSGNDKSPGSREFKKLSEFGNSSLQRHKSCQNTWWRSVPDLCWRLEPLICRSLVVFWFRGAWHDSIRGIKPALRALFIANFGPSPPSPKIGYCSFVAFPTFRLSINFCVLDRFKLIETHWNWSILVEAEWNWLKLIENDRNMIEIEWKSTRIWEKNPLKSPKIGFGDFAWKVGRKKTPYETPFAIVSEEAPTVSKKAKAVSKKAPSVSKKAKILNCK